MTNTLLNVEYLLK